MREKILNKLRKKDVGSIGIGAMIVFIAMVLVAGIAASVLIQTSTKLETQAMISGQETIAEVSTGIAITQIQGYYDGTNGIEYLAIHVRPRAGSADIDLAETVIEISDSATKNLIIYEAAGFIDTDGINGDLFRTAAFTNADATHFDVVVLEDADSSCSGPNPVINRGDHVVLAIDANGAFGYLNTRQDIFGQVIPEEGSTGVISFTTPASFFDTVIELQ